MSQIKLAYLLVSIIGITLIFKLYEVDAQTCTNVGTSQVFYDPTCSNAPGPGCNAGGQGQDCRFCGFDIFPPCPTSTQSTTATTKPTTTTTRATTTTTKANSGSSESSTSGGGSVTVQPTQGTQSPIVATNGPIPSGTLIFSDDFDNFNLNVWKHDLTMSGGGNWEFQLYHNNRTNSYVKDGVLYIKPTLTEDRIGEANLRMGYRLDMWGGSPADQCTGNGFYGCERTSGAGGNILNPIQSAKITTAESFSFKYGRVEVRAKLPKGDWLWPAIWMLPAKNVYGMWPASGEIDIMESRGNANYPHSEGGGADSFGSTLHWGADWSQNRYPLTHHDYHHSSLLSDDFHTYGLYWSKDRLYTYLDDPNNIILDVDMASQDFWQMGGFPDSYENPWRDSSVNAPFDQEFYLIINLAVGGTAGYFKDGVAGKPWSDKSSSSVNEFYAARANWLQTWKDDPTLQIDSVKVWSI